MQKLNVRLHDAETGDLLAMAQWSDSPLHGSRNAKVVMEEVVAEMLKKVRAATATTSASKSATSPAPRAAAVQRCRSVGREGRTHAD